VGFNYFAYVSGEKLQSFSLFCVDRISVLSCFGGWDISQFLSMTDFPVQVHISADFGVFETV
jgi:hypothetical protein